MGTEKRGLFRVPGEQCQLFCSLIRAAADSRGRRHDASDGSGVKSRCVLSERGRRDLGDRSLSSRFTLSSASALPSRCPTAQHRAYSATAMPNSRPPSPSPPPRAVASPPAASSTSSNTLKRPATTTEAALPKPKPKRARVQVDPSESPQVTRLSSEFKVPLKDAEVFYVPAFVEVDTADGWYEQLLGIEGCESLGEGAPSAERREPEGFP